MLIVLKHSQWVFILLNWRFLIKVSQSACLLRLKHFSIFALSKLHSMGSGEVYWSWKVPDCQKLITCSFYSFHNLLVAVLLGLAFCKHYMSSLSNCPLIYATLENICWELSCTIQCPMFGQFISNFYNLGVSWNPFKCDMDVVRVKQIADCLTCYFKVKV